MPSATNPYFGFVRNPYNAAHIPGGSSGGSGAIVAARIVPAALGEDSGGSIRLPAALNGVFGLFPSPGRVPLDGVVIGGAVSAAGPLTRDVKDAGLICQHCSDTAVAFEEIPEPARAGHEGRSPSRDFVAPG